MRFKGFASSRSGFSAKGFSPPLRPRPQACEVGGARRQIRSLFHLLGRRVGDGVSRKGEKGPGVLPASPPSAAQSYFPKAGKPGGFCLFPPRCCLML